MEVITVVLVLMDTVDRVILLALPFVHLNAIMKDFVNLQIFVTVQELDTMEAIVKKQFVIHHVFMVELALLQINVTALEQDILELSVKQYPLRVILHAITLESVLDPINVIVSYPYNGMDQHATLRSALQIASIMVLVRHLEYVIVQQLDIMD